MDDYASQSPVITWPSRNATTGVVEVGQATASEWYNNIVIVLRGGAGRKMMTTVRKLLSVDLVWLLVVRWVLLGK